MAVAALRGGSDIDPAGSYSDAGGRGTANSQCRHRQQAARRTDKGPISNARITESFSRAIEQLASEKIEIRVGGIYTLERIAHDSLDDYRTVMETLTTFRQRAREMERTKLASSRNNEQV